MTTSELRKRLSEAKVGQFFNICVDAIIHAELLEEEIKRLRELLDSMPEVTLAFKNQSERALWNQWKRRAYNPDGTIRTDLAERGDT